MEREVVILFSGPGSHNVYISPLEVSHQSEKSQIPHLLLEVNRLPCWQLLVTQAERQRNFLHVHPHTVALSSGLVPRTGSLCHLILWYLSEPTHQGLLWVLGAIILLPGLGEPMWPGGGGKKAPQWPFLQAFQRFTFLWTSQQEPFLAGLQQSEAEALENLAFSKGDKYLLWP